MPNFIYSSMLSCVAIGALTTGCGTVETYDVGVLDGEVRDAHLAVQNDRAEPLVSVTLWLADPDPDDDRCPALRGDTRISVVADGEVLEADLVADGGGTRAIDCALKCPDLIRFESVCSPALAQLDPDGSQRVLEADEVAIRIEDGSGEVSQPLGVAHHARSVRFPEGDVLVIEPGDDWESSLPLEWSHPDDHSLAANDSPERWSVDTRVRIQVVDGAPRLFSAAPAGPRVVYFFSTAPVADCAFGDCTVDHVFESAFTVERP